MKVVQFIACLLCLAVTLPMAWSLIPGLSDKVDRNDVPIRVNEYQPKKALRVWHGSTKVIQPNEIDRPFWLSSWSTNAAASAFKKGDAKFYLHLYELDPALKLLNLRPNAAFNQKALTQVLNKPKVDPTNLDDLNLQQMQKIRQGVHEFTMGNPSNVVTGAIPNSKLCRDYHGWRSAWDQDEFMICPGKKAVVKKLVLLVECDRAALARHYTGVDTTYTYNPKFNKWFEPVWAKKAVPGGNCSRFYGMGALGKAQCKSVTAKAVGALTSFDMQIKGDDRVLDWLEKKTGVKRDETVCKIIEDNGW